MDVQAATQRLLRRNYNMLGSAFAFRHPTTAKAVSLLAIDRTSAAIVVGEKAIQVTTVKPCVTVLSADLAALNIDPSLMIDVIATFNGNSFRVMTATDKPDPAAHLKKDTLRPVPNWQTLGEILFILMDAS